MLDKRCRIRNRKLAKKYPFLIPFKGWKGDREVYGWPKGEKYQWLCWDFWPRGWMKSFGNLFLEDLAAAVKKSGYERVFHVTGGKEKWGRCVVECGPYSDEIMHVLTTYETLSENICCVCGKPDVKMIVKGWIHPKCYDCFKNEWISYRNEGEDSKSDAELRAIYADLTGSGSNAMADEYVLSYGSGEKKIMDIRPAAEKIRAKWRMKHAE